MIYLTEDRWVMDVKVNGAIEKREVDRIDKSMPHAQWYQPKLNAGEHVVWVIGDDVPHIVQVQEDS